MTKLKTGVKNKLLRAVSLDVQNIKAPEIQKIIKEMTDALGKIKIGVGLAAPQIGKNLRIFIIAKELAETMVHGHAVFINPKIMTQADQKIQLEEGCLSLPNIWGKIERSVKVKIEAMDERGKKFKIKNNGLIAQIFQHEIDHLNGILFSDHAVKIWKIKRTKQK